MLGPLALLKRKRRNRLGGNAEMSTTTRQDQTQAVTTVDPTAITRYESSHGEVALGVQIVREMISPQATPLEAALFVEFCRSQKLNPFVGDVYLVKYRDNRPASFIVGKQTFMRRSEQHPQFEGFEAGLIVKPKDGPSFDIDGEMVPEECTLSGGWARVYRKDRSKPIVARVPLRGYDQEQSIWKTHQSTMIRKVALVHALREAFPHSLAGLTDAAETGDVEALDTAYEGTIVGAVGAPPAQVAAPEPEPELEAEAVTEQTESPISSLTDEQRYRNFLRRAFVKLNLTPEQVAHTLGVPSIDAVAVENLVVVWDELEELAAEL